MAFAPIAKMSYMQYILLNFTDFCGNYKETNSIQESLNPETEVPSAPDLDVLVEAEHEPEMPTTWATEEEIEPEVTDWSDNWFGNLEQQ